MVRLGQVVTRRSQLLRRVQRRRMTKMWMNWWKKLGRRSQTRYTPLISKL